MRIRRVFLSRSLVVLALLVSQMVSRGALAQSLPHLSLPAGAEAVNAAELGVDGTGTARWVVTALRGQEILVATGRDGQPGDATLLPSPPATGRLNREPLPLVEEAA